MKSLLTIATLIITVITTGCSSSKENSLLKEMYSAGLSVPDHIQIDAGSSLETTLYVTYQLGGRTCESTLSKPEGQTLMEANKRCYY